MKVSKLGFLAVSIFAVLFFTGTVWEWVNTPTIVKSVITGKPIRIIYSDGTQRKINKLTELPKKYNLVWEYEERKER